MKAKYAVLLIILCVLLPGCKKEEAIPAPSIPPTIVPTVVPTDTSASVTEPTETVEKIPVTTAPEHSDLYIPGVSVEEVIQYFNEVCLNAEFVNSGDPSYLQKWVDPIQYILFGNPTDEDLATLSAFTQWLNTIDGFPGISQTTDVVQANLRIHFCTEAELLDRLGDQFYGTDGGVTFWYLHDEIYDAIICCRTDLDQQLRNSVILEELYNGLGPVQDTDLRPDSIIYSGYSEPQKLTPVDELLLRLLYNPQLVCGMNADACAEVIRMLYY